MIHFGRKNTFNTCCVSFCVLRKGLRPDSPLGRTLAFLLVQKGCQMLPNQNSLLTLVDSGHFTLTLKRCKWCHKRISPGNVFSPLLGEWVHMYSAYFFILSLYFLCAQSSYYGFEQVWAKSSKNHSKVSSNIAVPWPDQLQNSSVFKFLTRLQFVCVE